MRLVWLVLAITAGIAHADSPWSEFGVGQRLQPLQQLTDACEVDIEFRGAVVEVELRHRLSNPGPAALGATRELVLPAGAQLVGVGVQRGKGAVEPAIAVAAPVKSERVGSEKVLGADPAIVTALAPDDRGRARFRVIVQPIDGDDDLAITTRWTQLAEIHGGALQVVLPGHEGMRCRASVAARPGPGARVDQIRVAGRPVTGPATIEGADIPVAVALAFKRTQPIVWTQQDSLGEGYTAQAITVIAPPVRALAAKRVLLVIDGSRSMELVGRHNVKKIAAALGRSLPAGTELEAIVFDRKATRVFGAWKAADAAQLAAIDQAIESRTPGNGSDLVAAFTLAKQAIGDSRAVVVLISDGVLGEQPSQALAQALATTPAAVDLHAIVLAPGNMRSPNADVVRAPIGVYGGSYVELSVGDLDPALARASEWLQPSLAVTGLAAPVQLRAGSGVVSLRVGQKLAKLALTSRAEPSDKPAALTPAAAPPAPIAQLALAGADAEIESRLAARHPRADEAHAFVVLASAGKVAKHRRAVVAGGGPYLRSIAVDDPAFPPEIRLGGAAGRGGSAIDRDTLKLLFRTHLQPAAYACYQKALPRKPALAGTAQFQLEIGRGELTQARVSGLGDPQFETCLLDAAYLVTPPLPNPDYNADDRTIANYPLTFSVRENKPLVVPGDGDSSSALDIDAIEGGVPRVVRPGDTSTPLGNLRP